MSDVRPKTEREGNLEVTKRRKTPLHTQVLDADRTPSSSDNYQNHPLRRSLACHDVGHWHGPACRLPDCRLGLLEGKLGSSFCRPWSTTVEEPPRRCRSLDLAFKPHQSVAMLPQLLSNLAVSRTRSEPCIFGKDFLRITLPLPGELNACEASATSVGPPEKSMPPGDAELLIELETRKGMVVLTPPTSELQACDETMTQDTNANLRTQRSWDGVLLDEVAQGQLNSLSSCTPVHKSVEKSHESHKLEVGQACCLSNSLPHEKAGIGSQVVGLPASKTPHWDDWWICQPEESSAAKLTSDSLRVHRFRDQSCSPASLGEDEDVSDEGYLVLDETGDEQQQESHSEDAGSDEEGSLENVCDADDCANEDSPTTTDSNNSRSYKEDDIWSDDQFGTLRMKVFPPPISILAHETQPGLLSHVSKTLWRSVKRDGRFVLQEVQARPREFFQATREFGRLRLQLVRPDSDSAGSYTETASLEDKGGFSPPSGSVKTFTEVSGINQPEVTGIESSEAGPSSLDSSLQGFLPYRYKDEVSKGEGNVEDGNLFWKLTNELGSMFQEEYAGASCGQISNGEELGGRTAAGLIHRDCVNKIDSDDVIGASSGVDCSSAIEATYRDDEGFGRTNNLVMMDPDLKQIEISDHIDGILSTGRGSEEPYRQEYQQPRFSATYGFDNNLSVLSPSQAFIQFPIQPAVR